MIGVGAEQLDCMQVNLALLAERHHGVQRSLALGAVLRFEPREGDGGLPTIEPLQQDYLNAAERWLGLRVVECRDVGSASELLALCDKHGCLYVVADAFHLHWVPYFGHKHMEHSFLLEVRDEGVLISDSYHNDTQWGPARPGTWSLSAEQLAEALPEGARAFALAPQVLPDDALPEPLVLVADPQGVNAYLRAYREHPDQVEALERLTLETWLMARSRQLHAALHLQVGATDGEAIAEHLTQWRLLVEHTYLAYRRSLRGNSAPTAVFERLAELLVGDVRVFAVVTLRDRIADVVAQVLDVTKADILAGTPFPSFATFSSFRVVEIVERLEDRLGVLFDPDDLVPENLHCIDDLCRIAACQPEESSNEPVAQLD